MLREEARVWSIKFLLAMESSNAVDTVHEGQSTSVMDTPGGGKTHDCPSALVNPRF